MVLPFWKAVWQFLKISNLESPHDPAIPLLWINPNTCARMFTAARFLTPQRGKPPKWPSISDQTDTHNGVHSHSGIWLGHEKERSSDTGYDVDGPWTHNTQWEKADTGRHTARDSIYRKCPKQAKPQRMKAGLCWLGARGGGWMDGWMDGCERLLLNHERHQDSWPLEEKNSICGQRQGLITQSFCVIKFY